MCFYHLDVGIERGGEVKVEVNVFRDPVSVVEASGAGEVFPAFRIGGCGRGVIVWDIDSGYHDACAACVDEGSVFL